MEAVIFIGIQAAGKSSFYQARFSKTHVRISLDMLRTRHRETLLLHACIEMKQPFVVDNTNPTVVERAKYIVPALLAGFQIIGYYFESNVGACIARNSTRPESDRVPPKGIAGTARRLQPPAFSEGFDTLHYVKPLDKGRFDVREWLDGT